MSGTLARDRAGSVYCTEDLTKTGKGALELAARTNLVRSWLSF